MIAVVLLVAVFAALGIVLAIMNEHPRREQPKPPTADDAAAVDAIEDSWRRSGFCLRRDWGAEVRAAHRRQQVLHAPLRALVDDAKEDGS